MARTLKLTSVNKTLIYIVILVHFMFFALEAVLWITPPVHNLLLSLLNNPVDLDYPTQTLVLKNLFINQGFYNLFLVIGGLTGLYLVGKQKYAAGYAVILFLCFAGIGAGIVLACSTKAYLFALCQAIPAAFAYFKIYPVFNSLS